MRAQAFIPCEVVYERLIEAMAPRGWLIAAFGSTYQRAVERILVRCPRAFAASVRTINPRFGEAVDRLVERLKTADVGASAPGEGDLLPPFYLPDEEGRILLRGVPSALEQGTGGSRIAGTERGLATARGEMGRQANRRHPESRDVSIGGIFCNLLSDLIRAKQCKDVTMRWYMAIYEHGINRYKEHVLVALRSAAKVTQLEPRILYSCEESPIVYLFDKVCAVIICRDVDFRTQADHYDHGAY